MQFTDDALGQKSSVSVENEDARIVDRTADWRVAGARVRFTPPERHIDRRLGRSVSVAKRHVQPTGEPGDEIPRQHLSGTEHLAQRVARLEPWFLHEQSQERWDDLQDGDPGVADRPDEIRRVAVAARFGQDDDATDQQRRDQLPHRGVEAVRRLLQHAVFRTDFKLVEHPPDTVADTAVGNHHAFRLTGRTRGVHHISGIIRRRKCALIRLRILSERPPRMRVGLREIERHDPHPGDQRPQSDRRKNHHRLRFRDHVREPRHRVFGIERQIGRARLQGREHRDHHLQRALEADPDHTPGAGTESEQLSGQSVRFGIQPLVAEGHSAEAHGVRGWPPRDPCFYGTHERLERARARSGIEILKQAGSLARLDEISGMHRLPGIGCHGRETCPHAATERRRLVVCQHVRVIVDLEPCRIGVHRQRKLGAFGSAPFTDLEPIRQLSKNVKVQEVECGLKERAATILPNDLRERVTAEREDRLFQGKGLLDQRGPAFPRHGDTERQQIEEKTAKVVRIDALGPAIHL